MSLSFIQGVAISSADIGKSSKLTYPQREPSLEEIPTSDTGTEGTPHKNEIEEVLKTLNEYTSTISPDIQFYKDSETGLNVIKAIDTKTHTVLRQFPTEEALSIARSIDKMRGLLINQKA